MKVLTAKEAKDLRLSMYDDLKVAEFNRLVQEGLGKGGKFEVQLPFETFGDEWEDVEFVQQAGYSVYRINACSWWEVTFFKEAKEML